MVDVGIVRMGVRHPRMSVRVAMRLSGRITRCVLVLMMRVVHVRVHVVHCLVHVYVLVPLGDVQPNTEAHASRRDPE